MQEFRIALKASIPFNLEVHNPAVGMIEILKKAQSEIAKKFGINMDLDHAIVRPREPKAPTRGPVTATEVAQHQEKMNRASTEATQAFVAPIVEKVVESAESLLSGPSFKELAATAKAKREAEKTGEAA